MSNQVLTYSFIKDIIYDDNANIQRKNASDLVDYIESTNDTICLKICYKSHMDYLYYKNKKWSRTLFSDESSKVFIGVSNSKEVSNVLNHIVNESSKIEEFRLLTNDYSLDELSLMEHNKTKYQVITVDD